MAAVSAEEGQRLEISMTPPSHHRHTEGREDPVPEAVYEQIAAHIFADELIPAIKKLRTATRCGLKEALDACRAGTYRDVPIYPSSKLSSAQNLIDENAYLSNRVKALEAAFDAAIAIANEAAEEWDKAPNGMRAGKILLALAGHRKGYRADIDAIHSARTTLTHGEGK